MSDDEGEVSAKRPRFHLAWDRLFTLMVGGGLAAVIAGLSSMSVELLKQPESAAEKRCEIAAQLLQRDRFNPMLARTAIAKIQERAYRAVVKCLGYPR